MRSDHLEEHTRPILSFLDGTVDAAPEMADVGIGTGSFGAVSLCHVSGELRLFVDLVAVETSIPVVKGDHTSWLVSREAEVEVCLVVALPLLGHVEVGLLVFFRP